GVVTVTWTAPADNGGAAITAYKVTAVAGGGPVRFYTTVGAPTSLAISGLPFGASYQFYVQAVNQAGTSAASTYSNGVFVDVGAVPGAPAAGTRQSGALQATGVP